MKQVKVKLVYGIVWGPGVHKQPGDIFDVDENVARDLIQSNKAEKYEPPPEKEEKPEEGGDPASSDPEGAGKEEGGKDESAPGKNSKKKK